MVADLEANPAEIAELDTAMPLNDNILRAQAYIENMAQSVNVTVSSINISGNTDAVWAGNKDVLSDPFKVSRTLQKVSGSIVVSGTYDQLVAFLKKTEASGRIININTLGLEGATDGNINLILTVDLFYLAPSTQ
jgi:Tfp pilus assembly protein PilO